MGDSNAEGIRNLCAVATHILQTMEVNAATKFAVRTVLREAANKSNANYKGNDNKKNARYKSTAARNAESNNSPTISDHAIPLSLMLNKVYGMKEVNVDDLVALVKNYCVMVKITKDEDSALTAAGLKKTMPQGWDEKDHLARYKHVGIDVHKIES